MLPPFPGLWILVDSPVGIAGGKHINSLSIVCRFLDRSKCPLDSRIYRSILVRSLLKDIINNLQRLLPGHGRIGWHLNVGNIAPNSGRTRDDVVGDNLPLGWVRGISFSYLCPRRTDQSGFIRVAGETNGRFDQSQPREISIGFG